MKSIISNLKLDISMKMTVMLSTVIILLSLLQPANGQTTVNSGTTLRVSPGTTLVTVGTLIIQSGSTVNNQGTIILKSNLNNLNPSTNDIGTGTIVLNGTTLQTVNGSNTMGTLSINNASGAMLNGNTTINTALNLALGVIDIGPNNFVIGTVASITGSPSASSMVIADESGEFRKLFSGTGSFTYPVGDNSGTNEYTPVTITFTAGSFNSSSYAGVKLTNSAHPTSSGSYLNRYWTLSQSNIAAFVSNIIFQYVTTDIVGAESQIYCARVEPSPTVYYDLANTTLHRLTANGVTAFGTFTGQMMSTDKTLNLTLYLEGLYIGSGTMRKAQNEMGDQFGGNTADQIRIELHSPAPYSTVVYTVNNVNLNTMGLSTVIIPSIYSGSYYLTVKHRNSIETTTAAPVSLATSPVNYDFSTSAAQAFGANQVSLGGGEYGIFTGDVDQDGSVGVLDMALVDNQAAIFGVGYLPEDIDGDGSIGVLDMGIIDNNSANFVSALLPF